MACLAAVVLQQHQRPAVAVNVGRDAHASRGLDHQIRVRCAGDAISVLGGMGVDVGTGWFGRHEVGGVLVLRVDEGPVLLAGRLLGHVESLVR